MAEDNNPSIAHKLTKFFVTKQTSASDLERLLGEDGDDFIISRDGDDNVSLSNEEAEALLDRVSDDISTWGDTAVTKEFPDFEQEFAAELASRNESIAQSESSQPDNLSGSLKNALAEFQKANSATQTIVKDSKLAADLPQDWQRTKLCTNIVNEAIKLAGGNTSKKLNYEAHNAITTALVLRLETLDTGYLESAQKDLARGFAKNFVKDKIFGKNLRALKEILHQYDRDILHTRARENNAFVEKQINQQILAHQLSELQIAERLSKFLTRVSDQYGKFGQEVTTDQSKTLEIDYLRMIRQRDPREFDKIIFPQNELEEIGNRISQHREKVSQLTKQGDSSKNNKFLATDILLKILSKFSDKFGLKVSKQENQKIFDKLHPVLAKFDPRYLASDNKEIMEDILADLRGRNIKVKDKDATFSLSGLDKIASRVSREHQVKNDKFVKQQVKEDMLVINQKLAEHQVTNSMLGTRVAEFLSDGSNREAANRLEIFSENDEIILAKGDEILADGKKIPVEIILVNGMEKTPMEFGSKLTDKQLADLRRINPQKFDVMVFQGQDLGKIADEKKNIHEKILGGVGELDLKGMHVIADKDFRILNHEPKDPRVKKILDKQQTKKVSLPSR